MLVTRITSFMLLFVLLSNTEAKPTSTLRQKRAPKVNKRPLQFPRLGGKRSIMPTNFETYTDTNVAEILPVLSDELLDILQMSQNDLTSRQVDQDVYVNKRKIQFPRLGRKRSLIDSQNRIREYAEKMIQSAASQVDPDVLRKLEELMNKNSDNQTDGVIII